MRRVKGESPAEKKQYDHILLLWAVLLGGGMLAATVFHLVLPELGYPMAILFILGFLVLWLLSPALAREKALTHFEPAAVEREEAEAPPAPAKPEPQHSGHPLTQSTPVLIVDEEQLMKFIAENPHPQTGQFNAIVKEMQKKA